MLNKVELGLIALVRTALTQQTTPLPQELTAGQLFPMIKKHQIAPMILHAMSGAYFARDEYPSLVDDEVFLAIYRHTTGDADMTLFQMIVYVADLIEDGRKQPFCVNLREEFWKSVDRFGWQAALEKTFLSSLRSTILSFSEKMRVIAPETLNAYNFMLFRDQEIE